MLARSRARSHCAALVAADPEARWQSCSVPTAPSTYPRPGEAAPVQAPGGLVRFPARTLPGLPSRLAHGRRYLRGKHNAPRLCPPSILPIFLGAVRRCGEGLPGIFPEHRQSKEQLKQVFRKFLAGAFWRLYALPVTVPAGGCPSRRPVSL